MVRSPLQLSFNLNEGSNQLSFSSALSEGKFGKFVQGSVVLTGTDATRVSLREGLNADSRILRAGIQNVNAGISLINRTEEALSAIDALASEIKELADNASLQSTTNETRSLLDKEAQLLVGQTNEIITESTYLETPLFSSGGARSTLIRAGIPTGADLGLRSVEQNSITETVETVITTGTGGTLDETTALGTFSALGDVGIAGTKFLSDVELADFNGDGNLDLLTSDVSTVGIQLGNGDGTFSAVRQTFGINQDSIAGSLVIKDFNGDGNLDVLAGAEGNDNGDDSIYLALGDGAGGFLSSNIIITSPTDIHELTVVDLDGDNNLDILTGRDLKVYYGTGPGTFETTETSYNGSTNVRNVEVADIDGDSNLDLIFSNDKSANLEFGILYGDGSRTFNTRQVQNTGSSGGKVLAFDFDGDSDIDIVSARRDSTNNGGFTELAFFKNDGFGNFTEDSTVNLGAAFAEDVGFEIDKQDIDGDGDLDVIVANAGNDSVSVAVNDGSGSFTVTDYAVGSTPTGIGFGDVDGDGVIDIVSANKYANSVSVLIQGSTFVPGTPGSAETTELFVRSLSEIDLTTLSSAVRSQKIVEGVRSQSQQQLGLQQSTRRRYEQEVVFLGQEALINEKAAEGLPSFEQATDLSKKIQIGVLQDFISGAAAQVDSLDSTVVAGLLEE